MVSRNVKSVSHWKLNQDIASSIGTEYKLLLCEDMRSCCLKKVLTYNAGILPRIPTYKCNSKAIKKQFMQLFFVLLKRKSQLHSWIWFPLKSALSIDDTLQQKCFNQISSGKNEPSESTYSPFFRCRKYQSADKSYKRHAAIHSPITLIAVVRSSLHDLTWEFLQITLDQRKSCLIQWS